MASRAESRVVNPDGLVQGITLVTFPAASSIFTNRPASGCLHRRPSGAPPKRRRAAVAIEPMTSPPTDSVPAPTSSSRNRENYAWTWGLTERSVLSDSGQASTAA
jgi:hypothetical protein